MFYVSLPHSYVVQRSSLRISTYEQLLFANFGETTTISLQLVTTIDHFMANLNSRFLYSIWSICIDFSRFRLAGGAVIICMLHDFDQEITSDLDFFYTGTNWADFLDSLVNIFLYVHVHIWTCLSVDSRIRWNNNFVIDFWFDEPHYREIIYINFKSHRQQLLVTFYWMRMADGVLLFNLFSNEVFR